MADTVAVVFPLPEKVVKRIFSDQRTVFVKYMPNRGKRGINKTRIEPGTSLIVYQSKGDKSLVGEALVKKATFLMPNDAYQTYGNKLCLNRDELTEYSDKFPNRQEKPLLVLELESPHIYEKPVKWPYAITMVGRYLSKSEYDSLF